MLCSMLIMLNRIMTLSNVGSTCGGHTMEILRSLDLASGMRGAMSS